MPEQITLKHLDTVLEYVTEQGSITNRECRKATGLGYDSSIKLFGALCTVGLLRKTGGSSATKYILPQHALPKEVITMKHLRAVVDYVSKHGSITNRDCRETIGVVYNSCIKLFGALCALGILRKLGANVSTQYVIAHPQEPKPRKPGYHRKEQL